MALQPYRIMKGTVSIMKRPGIRAIICGVLLGIVSVALMFGTTDQNLRGKGLVWGIGALTALVIGICQYLSYALRSEEGKAAYRSKYGAQGLYHSLVITATSSGALTKGDLEYIKRVYNETFRLPLRDEEILKLEKRISRSPDVYLKDIKIYANRIEESMREQIIRYCIELATRKDNNAPQDILQKLTTSLRIEPKFLTVELAQRNIEPKTP